jgi:hypothetical protein
MSTSPVLRPLAFGEVLDAAFGLYRRNFFALAALVLVPAAVGIAGLVMTGVAGAAGSGAGSVLMLLLLGVALIVSMVSVWGALTHLFARAYGGPAPSVGDALGAGLRAFFSLLGAGFLAWVAMLAAGLGLGIVFGVLAVVLGDGIGGIVALIVLYPVSIVTNLVISALFFFAAPAVMAEGKGALAAVSRSVELARGAIGRIVGLYVVSVMILYLPVAGVGFVAALATGIGALGGGAEAVAAGLFLFAGLGLAFALVTPFLLAVAVVQYFDRRVRTEALDVQAVADRLALA